MRANISFSLIHILNLAINKSPTVERDCLQNVYFQWKTNQFVLCAPGLIWFGLNNTYLSFLLFAHTKILHSSIFRDHFTTTLQTTTTTMTTTTTTNTIQKKPSRAGENPRHLRTTTTNTTTTMLLKRTFASIVLPM